MGVIKKFNVTISGRSSGQPMVFAHGFGCDQHMWRHVTPRFEDEFRVILFDLIGAGGSDLTAFDPDRYDSLNAYADDVLTICRELELNEVIFVGHSVSAMIGILAAVEDPERFAKLVLVGPSPRYINDQTYVGGFSESDIAELLDSLESNYLGWSSAMAPVIMGNVERPELGEELSESFCRTDPEIARRICPGDLSVGQPSRSGQGRHTCACIAMPSGCHCPGRGWGVCRGCLDRQHTRAA